MQKSIILEAPVVELSYGNIEPSMSYIWSSECLRINFDISYLPRLVLHLSEASKASKAKYPELARLTSSLSLSF